MRDILTEKKGTQCSKVAFMFQKKGLHFTLGPVIDSIGQSPLRDFVLTQKVTDKVNSWSLVEFGIEVCDLPYIVRKKVLR